MPSPAVVRTTAPSRSVAQSLSLAGTATQSAGVARSHRSPSNEVSARVVSPPSTRDRRLTTMARGWQYSRFIPSPAFPAETTAYRGLALERNAGEVDVSLP